MELMTKFWKKMLSKFLIWEIQLLLKLWKETEIEKSWNEFETDKIENPFIFQLSKRMKWA